MQIIVKPIDFLTKKFAKTFLDYMDDIERFTKNYYLLLNNLSEEQKGYLINIFARILSTNYEVVQSNMIFWPDEVNEQRNMEKYYFPKLMIDGQVFKYNRHIIPIKHFESSVFYYKMGMDFVSNVECIKNRDVIDVGAFIGDSALVFNEYNPKKVYAFEPVEENYVIMEKTISLNNLQDIVVPVKSGLGSSRRQEKIFIKDSASSAVSWNETENIPSQQFEVFTLDGYVEQNNLDVALIKVDTEGMEVDCIRGAIETIKKFKPVLILSIYHNAEQFFELKPIIESLDLGYTFQFKKLNPYSVIFETVMICQVQ